MAQPDITSKASSSVEAASLMVLAGICFAGVNTLTQYVTMRLGLASTTVAFWQYFAALLFGVPWLVKNGLTHLRTANLKLHLLRVALASVGVQFWIAGLASVPIWQAIALVMTSPFFVTLGASLFLGEKIGAHRWLATLLGFTGGMIILAPWSDAFSLDAVLPVVAAVLWAGVSLITKRLTVSETPESITIYLLLLLTPINAALAFGDGGFLITDELAIMMIGILGILTMLAQFFIAKAYDRADASYIQPFDHLKLPLNILAGWLVFGFLPTGNLWIGAVMIVAASLYIVHRESVSGKARN
ncbi:DMT family transporter [Kordiimonas sp. SCSIO 12610]|uniref:DMT family transporter n=1 Tax=Kordiimonas sp. SCSIO 12610 TaxID=2829597 RepID=UPI00210D5605|nr:DMT family transporter [Kordiimonas sp. SCSIO 12610]UTW55247.1 DMT family transporter [Kordiimonas sp. SCSIO 12610]